MWILTVIALLSSTFGAGMLLRFYLDNLDPAYLAWSVSLAMFAAASACAFIGSYDAWSEATARIYYLTAVALFTGSMSLGTVYINSPRAVGHIWAAILAAVAILAAALLIRAGVDSAALAATDEPGWRAVEVSPFLLGVVSALNSVGTLILVVAAVAGIVYRRAGREQTLVAAGVILVGLGGALARLDDWEWSSLGQALGIWVIIFATVRLARTGIDSQTA